MKHIAYPPRAYVQESTGEAENFLLFRTPFLPKSIINNFRQNYSALDGLRLQFSATPIILFCKFKTRQPCRILQMLVTKTSCVRSILQRLRERCGTYAMYATRVTICILEACEMDSPQTVTAMIAVEKRSVRNPSKLERL